MGAYITVQNTVARAVSEEYMNWLHEQSAAAAHAATGGSGGGSGAGNIINVRIACGNCSPQGKPGQCNVCGTRTGPGAGLVSRSACKANGYCSRSSVTDRIGCCNHACEWSTPCSWTPKQWLWNEEGKLLLAKGQAGLLPAAACNKWNGQVPSSPLPAAGVAVCARGIETLSGHRLGFQCSVRSGSNCSGSDYEPAVGYSNALQPPFKSDCLIEDDGSTVKLKDTATCRYGIGPPGVQPGTLKLVPTDQILGKFCSLPPPSPHAARADTGCVDVDAEYTSAVQSSPTPCGTSAPPCSESSCLYKGPEPWYALKGAACVTAPSGPTGLTSRLCQQKSAAGLCGIDPSYTMNCSGAKCGYKKKGSSTPYYLRDACSQCLSAVIPHFDSMNMPCYNSGGGQPYVCGLCVSALNCTGASAKECQTKSSPAAEGCSQYAPCWPSHALTPPTRIPKPHGQVYPNVRKEACIGGRLAPASLTGWPGKHTDIEPFTETATPATTHASFKGTEGGQFARPSEKVALVQNGLGWVAPNCLQRPVVFNRSATATYGSPSGFYPPNKEAQIPCCLYSSWGGHAGMSDTLKADLEAGRAMIAGGCSKGACGGIDKKTKTDSTLLHFSTAKVFPPSSKCFKTCVANKPCASEACFACESTNAQGKGQCEDMSGCKGCYAAASVPNASNVCFGGPASSFQRTCSAHSSPCCTKGACRVQRNGCERRGKEPGCKLTTWVDRCNTFTHASNPVLPTGLAKISNYIKDNKPFLHPSTSAKLSDKYPQCFQQPLPPKRTTNAPCRAGAQPEMKNHPAVKELPRLVTEWGGAAGFNVPMLWPNKSGACYEACTCNISNNTVTDTIVTVFPGQELKPTTKTNPSIDVLAKTIATKVITSLKSLTASNGKTPLSTLHAQLSAKSQPMLPKLQLIIKSVLQLVDTASVVHDITRTATRQTLHITGHGTITGCRMTEGVNILYNQLTNPKSSASIAIQTATQAIINEFITPFQQLQDTALAKFWGSTRVYFLTSSITLLVMVVVLAAILLYRKYRIQR